MNLASIARVLDGEASGKNTISIPTPGHSRRDRGTTITLDPDAPGGILVNSFNGGDPIEVKDMVRQLLGMPDWQPGDGQDRRIRPDRLKEWDLRAVDREADEVFTWTPAEAKRIDRAGAIFDEGIDPRGTLGQIYTREHRKLELKNDLAGHVLRFHPRCPWRDENTGQTIYIPAVIAAFRSIDDGSLLAIHRIALRADGSKIDRRMLGIVHRCAVLIGTPANGELALGEGVETCMAARELRGFAAAWACGSKGLVAHFPVLPNVQHLILLGERDASSREAMRIVGRRWANAGRRVSVDWPKTGKDHNDELMARQRR